MPLVKDLTGDSDIDRGHKTSALVKDEVGEGGGVNAKGNRRVQPAPFNRASVWIGKRVRLWLCQGLLLIKIQYADAI